MFNSFSEFSVDDLVVKENGKKGVLVVGKSSISCRDVQQAKLLKEELQKRIHEIQADAL